MPTVRSAEVGDRDAILELVRAVFSSDGRDGQEEVDIVVASWDGAATPRGLELVATADGSVVGHVLGAWGDLGGRPAVGVAPLAVLPAHQGEGIGQALMAELIARADSAGLPLLVLLGNPAYYGRFGFEPSGPVGIHYLAVGQNSPYFQVRRLSAYDASWQGSFTYCWEQPGAK